MAIVIADTSPLQYLFQVGLIELHGLDFGGRRSRATMQP
jgi:hypothetical protein